MKAAKQAAPNQIATWAKELMPAVFADEVATVCEVRCSKPACPIETILCVMLPKPKEMSIPKPLVDVTRDDVAHLMHAWSKVIKRGQSVQAWAEHALPKPVAGSRVMVDEVEVPHVHNELNYETCIYVLASPPWAMKVLRRLEDVTQKNVEDLMALTALCGSMGVPSIR